MGKLKGMILAVVCAACTACAPLVLVGAGAAAGVAGVKYYDGSLTVIYHAPLDKTRDATLEVFRDMNITVTLDTRDISSAKIIGKRSDGKPVTVTLAYHTAQDTKADLRVGHLGNEGASMVLKERIRNVLFK